MNTPPETSSAMKGSGLSYTRMTDSRGFLISIDCYKIPTGRCFAS